MGQTSPVLSDPDDLLSSCCSCQWLDLAARIPVCCFIEQYWHSNCGNSFLVLAYVNLKLFKRAEDPVIVDIFLKPK